MKIKLELFGASRDFSDNDYLEIKVQDKSSIDDLRNEIIKYIDENFNGNSDFNTKEASIKIEKPDWIKN